MIQRGCCLLNYKPGCGCKRTHRGWHLLDETGEKISWTVWQGPVFSHLIRLDVLEDDPQPLHPIRVSAMWEGQEGTCRWTLGDRCDLGSFVGVSACAVLCAAVVCAGSWVLIRRMLAWVCLWTCLQLDACICVCWHMVPCMRFPVVTHGYVVVEHPYAAPGDRGDLPRPTFCLI